MIRVGPTAVAPRFSRLRSPSTVSFIHGGDLCCLQAIRSHHKNSGTRSRRLRRRRPSMCGGSLGKYNMTVLRSNLLLLYAARALRGFGDGFAIIVLPAYMAAI